MRLPRSILSAVRGPLAAAALAGCAGEPAAIEPEPVAPPSPVVAVPAPPIDPVAYDAMAEAARLGAMDDEASAVASRRNRRIAANEAAAARRVGPLFPRFPGGVNPACGRG